MTDILKIISLRLDWDINFVFLIGELGLLGGSLQTITLSRQSNRSRSKPSRIVNPVHNKIVLWFGSRGAYKENLQQKNINFLGHSFV